MPNLFPEDNNKEETSIEELEEPLEFKGSYLFDFEKGEFVTNPDGTIATCDDFQAYVQWCSKVMSTPRYKRGYSSLYGQEFKELIGSGLSRDAVELEVKRITQETLMVHLRTKEVINFKFKWSDNKEEVYYQYEVVTIYEERFMLDNTVKVG